MRWLIDSLSLFLQFGFTPLHLAAQNGDNSLVRVITNHPGVRVDSVTVKTVSNPGESVSGALLSLVDKALPRYIYASISTVSFSEGPLKRKLIN